VTVEVVAEVVAAAAAAEAGSALSDSYDVRLARGAVGLLRTFNEAGVLAAADAHVAGRVGQLGAETDERVLLAAALAVRGARLGSVCLDLAQVRHTVTVDDTGAADLAELPWPATAAWLSACEASPLVAVGVDGDPWRPLRLVDGLLYLDRYWRQEEHVRQELDVRAARPAPVVDAARLQSALQRLFPGDPSDRQRLAAAACALGWVTVVAGGPGTGKTTTVAKVMALLRDQPGEPARMALAAPTGKAAARLQEAVRAAAAGLDPADQDRLGEPSAATLHRLLGARPGSRSRFVHDRNNRLSYDVIVVDETSMVSLTLMSRLLAAVRSDARLILVGDPDQLASVEAGAVLGDLVARPAMPTPSRVDRLPAGSAPLEPATAADLDRGVVRLTRNWRYGDAISALAQAVQSGDADAVLRLLRRSAPAVSFMETDPLTGPVPAGLGGLREDVVAAGGELAEAARAGDAPVALDRLNRHRLLCAHRHGAYGVTRWTVEVERWLTAALGGYAADGLWYRGRPLLVTANDYDLKLYNGDTGVVVDGGSPAGAQGDEHGVVVAFGRGGAPVLVSPSRLSAVQTVHAMTIHRSQGSQFERISVLLPPAESPLLTRELFYTAITRATERVRVIGTEEAVRAAVERPVVRASGLRRRWAR
jgi:exodeoxyribonuclease V alpha subunit